MKLWNTGSLGGSTPVSDLARDFRSSMEVTPQLKRTVSPRLSSISARRVYMDLVSTVASAMKTPWRRAGFGHGAGFDIGEDVGEDAFQRIAPAAAGRTGDRGVDTDSQGEVRLGKFVRDVGEGG